MQSKAKEKRSGIVKTLLSSLFCLHQNFRDASHFILKGEVNWWTFTPKESFDSQGTEIDPFLGY